MPVSQQLDALEYDALNFPYNRVEHELSGMPRFIRGLNGYVTFGGKLVKRPGLLEVPGTTLTGRCDRLWSYETMEDQPKVYYVGSIMDATTHQYSLWWFRVGHSTAWTKVTDYRDVNFSRLPHEATIVRGRMYVKGYPAASSSEKLGSIILDGTTDPPVVKPWGILGPTDPAHISGSITALANDLHTLPTTFNVTHALSPLPTTPFDIYIDREQMTVLSIAGPTYTVIRGTGGTSPAPHAATAVVLYRDWANSDHQIVVLDGWRYTYGYVSITGQVSNRVALQTNVDKLPSITGPFFNLIPKITIQGHSDTVNIPFINIYRSSDGGGTYYKLKQITNTGAGAITFEDRYQESGSAGGVFADPVSDRNLNIGEIAPSLFSNTPPPTTNTGVIGVTDPAATTPIAYYSGRLWFAIGTTVYYSSQDELNEGIPEESFPVGKVEGNTFEFQYPVTNLIATRNALYISSLHTIYEVTGSNRETFNTLPLLENFGSPYGQPRAITRFGENICMLAHDYRIIIVDRSGSVVTISDPLFTDIVDDANASTQFEIKYWADLEKELILVAGHRMNQTELTRYWVYDIKKSQKVEMNFWNVPWYMRSTAFVVGRISETSSQHRVVLAMHDETTGLMGLSRLDPTLRTGSDWFINREIGIPFSIDTHLMTIPPGNHVNSLRKPATTPIAEYVQVERTIFAADVDPYAYYYKDDFWTDPIPLPLADDPARRELSKAYKTMVWQVRDTCGRIAIRFSKPASFDLIELQNLVVSFSADVQA